MEPYILRDEELNELVVKIPGWEIKSKRIQREFNFANFIEAFAVYLWEHRFDQKERIINVHIIGEKK